MALTSHLFQLPTYTPPVGLRCLFWGELYLYLYLLPFIEDSVVLMDTVHICCE